MGGGGGGRWTFSQKFSSSFYGFGVKVLYVHNGWLAQYVVFANWMLSCLVSYVERGGLTYRDRFNSSENNLLLRFLLAMPSQTVLLLVRQLITQDNCSISVSYRSSSNVTWLNNLLTLENEIKLLKGWNLVRKP